MRGHARSAGRRVRFDRIDELVGDLDRFVALVRSREPGKPLFLFGHSLGGLVTALYAIERQPDVAGVVLSAPGIAFDLPAFQAGAVQRRRRWRRTRRCSRWCTATSRRIRRCSPTWSGIR